LLLSGCNKKVEKADGKYKISIAEQYGLAYAPLQIMKEKKLLEKNLPDSDQHLKLVTSFYISPYRFKVLVSTFPN